MTSASRRETNRAASSISRQLDRKKQLEQAWPGLVIKLTGFWRCSIPRGVLHGEPTDLHLTRWKLGDLLNDIDAVIKAKGNRRWLSPRHRGPVVFPPPRPRR